MGKPSGGEPLRFDLSTRIAVPAPTTEDRVAIRRLDWAEFAEIYYDVRSHNPAFQFGTQSVLALLDQQDSQLFLLEQPKTSPYGCGLCMFV